ncbi:LOW QUALITY PROTEIN: uncharacterized protein LOC127694456 [Apodemus sylvaticus]|uniref:LOW QUALITY PROTEIN: uncharacterized protein LOC127694456 n=1 Tax=Apodemus sylvaticus TaxID=10129 RepID=UPI002242A4C6|nr:LOW QUALITY PROTEIN: uncharacterized protein LOC127694456 [Apodemus sylvaticus]
MTFGGLEQDIVKTELSGYLGRVRPLPFPLPLTVSTRDLQKRPSPPGHRVSRSLRVNSVDGCLNMADSLPFEDGAALAHPQQYPECVVVVHAQRYPVEKFSSTLLGSQHKQSVLSSSRMSRSLMILNVFSSKGRDTLRFVLGQPVLIIWSFLTGHLLTQSRKEAQISTLQESSSQVQIKKKKDLTTLGEGGEGFANQEDGSPVTERPCDQGKGSDHSGSASSAFTRLFVNGVLSSFIPKPGPLGRDTCSKNSGKSCIKEYQIAFKSSCKRNAIASSYSSSLAQWPPERICVRATRRAAPRATSKAAPARDTRGAVPGAAPGAVSSRAAGAAPGATACDTRGAVPRTAPGTAAGVAPGAASGAAARAATGDASGAVTGDVAYNTTGAAPGATSGNAASAAPGAAAAVTSGAATSAAPGAATCAVASVTSGAAAGAAPGDASGAAAGTDAHATRGALRGTTARATRGSLRAAAARAIRGALRGTAARVTRNSSKGAIARATRGSLRAAVAHAIRGASRGAAARAIQSVSKGAAARATRGASRGAAARATRGALKGVAARAIRGAAKGAPAYAAPLPGWAQLQVLAKKCREKSRERSSSGCTKKKKKKHREAEQATTTDDPQVQQEDPLNGLPTPDIPRPVRRKIPLLLPHSRGVPLILPQSPELCFDIIVDDFDLEKKTEMQWTKTLKGNGAKAWHN